MFNLAAGLAVLVAEGAIGWAASKAWKTGVADTRFGSFDHLEQPIRFWLSLSAAGVCILLLTAIAALFLVNA
jgi:hypothetical protein